MNQLKCHIPYHQIIVWKKIIVSMKTFPKNKIGEPKAKYLKEICLQSTLKWLEHLRICANYIKTQSYSFCKIETDCSTLFENLHIPFFIYITCAL